MNHEILISRIYHNHQRWFLLKSHTHLPQRQGQLSDERLVTLGRHLGWSAPCCAFNSKDSEDSASEPRQPTHGGRANPCARTSIGNHCVLIPYNFFIEEFQGVKQSVHIYFRHSTHEVPPFNRDNNQSRGVSSYVLGFQRKMWHEQCSAFWKHLLTQHLLQSPTWPSANTSHQSRLKDWTKGILKQPNVPANSRDSLSSKKQCDEK